MPHNEKLAEFEPAAPAGWFEKNGIAIAITLAGWLVWVGVWWGTERTTINDLTTRIMRLEITNPEQTRWQVEQNRAQIGVMEKDAREQSAQVSQIQGQLSAINVKLDTLADLMRLHKQQPQDSR